MLLSASSYLAQNKKISMSGNNEDLNSTLKKIEKLTGVSFLFGNNITNGKTISYNFRNYSLEEVLKTISDKVNISFSFTSGKQIIIKKKIIRYLLLQGEIKDTLNGELLPYSNISLIGTKYGYSANQEGRFSFRTITDYPCTLKINHIGYSPKTIIFTEESDSYGFLSVSLLRSDIEIPTVTVNSKTNDLLELSNKSGAFTVAPEQFGSLPRIGEADITRSLQLFPGITGNNFGASGINIHGGLPSENLITLDGIRLYHINHLFGFFGSFNPKTIKDVRIRKGAYPAKYGGKLSGIVELTAKSGNTEKFSLNLSASQSILSGIAEIPLAGNLNLLLSARRSISDFITGSVYDKCKGTIYKKSIDESAFVLDTAYSVSTGKSFHFFDSFAKITYLPDNNNLFSSSFMISDDQLNNNMAAGTNGSDRKSRWGNYGLSLKWYREWTDNFHSTVISSYSKYYTEYDMNDDLHSIYFIPDDLRDLYKTSSELNNNFIDFTLQIDTEWFLNENNTLQSGITFSNYDISYIEKNSFIGNRKALSNLSRKAFLASAYIDYTYRLGNIHINPGIRLNFFNASHDFHLEPRLSLVWLTNEKLSFNLALGRFHQYIMQRSDGSQVLDGKISWISANGIDIKPALADHIILGGKYSFEHYSMKLELYGKNQYNILEPINSWEYISESDQIIEQNKMIIYGLDFLFRKNAGNFTWWAGYGYCVTEVTSSSNNLPKNYPSVQDSPHNITLAGKYSLGNIDLSATWIYSSGKPYSIPTIKNIGSEETPLMILTTPYSKNSKRLPGTNQTDISLAYNLTFPYIKGTFGLSVFNLFNSRNIWHRSFSIQYKALSTYDINMLERTYTLFAEIIF